MNVCLCVGRGWTDPPPKESYQMSKGSIIKKKIRRLKKGIRKMRKKKKKKKKK
jgi:predicted phosphohydrolase